nr:hypothetical protein [Micromonospora polyrhachis]
MRKDELVKTLVKTLRAEGRRTASGKPSPGRAGKTGPARGSATRANTTRTSAARTSAARANTTRASAARASTARASTARASTAKPGAAKPSAARSGAAKQSVAKPGAAKSAGTRRSTAKPTVAKQGKATTGAGGIRQGGNMSRSLKYAQVISSPSDRPERPGRSLVTTNHDVIQRWARARNAKPATIQGTEHDGRPGVLTFNFPGWREGGKIQQITWDDWFKTFDARRVNFIYQEQKSDGRQSNFFRTESPDRQDA